MLLNTQEEIHALHLLTKERVTISSELRFSGAIAVDSVEMKLFFEDYGHMSMRNFSDADGNVIKKNAFVEKMAIDWIGRRIFWTESSRNRISVASLDGSGRKVVTNTIRKPCGIAIDSLSGLVCLV